MTVEVLDVPHDPGHLDPTLHQRNPPPRVALSEPNRGLFVGERLNRILPSGRVGLRRRWVIC